MNRSLFRLTGVTAAVLMIPYFVHAAAWSGHLFFAGMVIGILWCMFAVEYRGVWFGPEDPACPRKFEDSDLPVAKTIGMELEKRIREQSLYAWDLFFRPVRMPDGSRLYNIRCDFVPSSDTFLTLDSGFPPAELKSGVPVTLSLRAGLRGGELFLTELAVNRRFPLSGPANRRVSPLNLKNSDPALKAAAAAVANALPDPEEKISWGIAFLEYVRAKEPFLRVGLELVAPEKDSEFKFAGSVFSLKKGRLLALEFRMDPLLKNCSHAAKAGLWKRLMSFGN